MKVNKTNTNSKRNVLIFPGTLKLNGITASFRGLINNIDISEINLFVAIEEGLSEAAKDRLSFLPNEVEIIHIPKMKGMTIRECFFYVLYYKLNINNNFIIKGMKKIFKRKWEEYFGSLEIDVAIQYSGYGKYVTGIFGASSGKKVIYVHSDMEKELKARNNQHENTIRLAYKEYDMVIVVTEAMKNPTSRISGRMDNIYVINNFIDEKHILNKSKESILFQNSTISNKTIQEIIDIVQDKSICKFINIGRFSKEKCHERLIRAYEKYLNNKEDKEKDCLIIIGGDGSEWANVNEQVNKLKCEENIILIKSMENPYPILKKTNLLIQSSSYEAMGIVLMEAGVLGIPCCSTEIEGPLEFMKKSGGYLVENSENGIYNAMVAFEENKITPLNIDVYNHNKVSKKAFEMVIEK